MPLHRNGIVCCITRWLQPMLRPGDFDMAVKTQEKAIQSLSDKGKSELLGEFEKRLESYKRDIPWTDTQGYY